MLIERKIYLIKLKQGITNSQIHQEIKKIEKQYDGIIKYERKGNIFTCEFFDIPPFLIDDVYKELKANIGW